MEKSCRSFLFFFKDGKNISTAKTSYVNNTSKAVYCENYRGPDMGNLDCKANNWSYNNDHGNYGPKIGIPSNFTVENYEVFQVIKQN